MNYQILSIEIYVFKLCSIDISLNVKAQFTSWENSRSLVRWPPSEYNRVKRCLTSMTERQASEKFYDWFHGESYRKSLMN